MATWHDVARMALALPEATENPNRTQWRVKDKAFVFERPLRKQDFVALGDAAPRGPVLCAYVPDLVAKEALLAGSPDVYFTTPHFKGHGTVLVRLDAIDVAELEELVTEAWLARAPKRLATAFLASM